MLEFTPQRIHEVTQAVFVAAGAPKDLAAQVADVLVDNHLAGHDSHGIIRIPDYVRYVREGIIDPRARPGIVKETPNSALVDGHWTFGQVAANFGMDVAVRKAKENQVAVVGIVGCNHTGRLGAFTDRAVAQGVIAFMTVGRPGNGLVVPYGGARPALGTDPIAFAIPAGEQPPVVVDFATSAVAAGKVRVAHDKGEQLPPGCLVDKDGNPTTDPGEYFRGGMLLPFGGHKGYGLAVVAELLSGVLTAGNLYPNRPPQHAGTFIMAIDAAIFQPIDEYRRAADAEIARLKAIPPAPGFDAVLVPGEPEQRMRERRREAIPVPEATWEAVVKAAATVGLDLTP